MSTFAFDEAKTVAENMKLFFEHLATGNKEFAQHLESTLPANLEDFNRSSFNAATVDFLDAPKLSESNSP